MLACRKFAEFYQVMFGLQLEDLRELRDEVKGYYVSN
jgi:hypothetical protein